MGTRELIILILGLAIVGVVLRGLYVAINARKGQIKLAIDKNIPQDVDLEALEMSELPNGGARVIKRSAATGSGTQRLREDDLLDAGDAEPIPVLMDTVEISPSPSLLGRVSEPGEGPLQDRENNYQHGEAESFLQNPIIEGENRNSAVAESESDDLLFDYQDDSPAMGSGFDQPESAPVDWADQDAKAGERGGNVDSTHDFNTVLAAAKPEPAPGAESFPNETQTCDGGAETPDDEVWYEAEASASPYELSDDQYGDIAAEAEEEVDHLAEPEEQEERGSVRSFEDELGSFSFSAGERIGQRKASPEPVLPDPQPETAIDDQPELFERLDDYADELAGKSEEEVPEASQEGREASSPDTPSAEREDDGSRAEAGFSARFKEFVPAISRPTFLKRQAPAESEVDSPDSEDGGFNEISESRPEAKKATVVDIKDAPPPTTETSSSSLPTEPSEVIVLNIMAGEGYEYYGADLLQVLLSQELTFGDMNIFHRRVSTSRSPGAAQGPVVFSLANIVNPGVFDLNRINEFRTPGVSLFLALPSPINNVEAFEDMLQVAQHIRGTLGGELKDDQRNGMTAQTIEHYRQRIRDFELLRLKSASQRS